MQLEVYLLLHNHRNSHVKHDPFKNPSKFFIWRYSLFSFLFGRSYYGKLLQALNLKGHESILDFGSGIGTLSKNIAENISSEGHLTSLEISEPLLSKTKNKLRNYNNIDFVLGDIRTADISPNSFDIIVSTWVLHHLEPASAEETLQALSDVLKPEGRIYVIEFPEKFHKSDVNFLDLFKQLGYQNQILFMKRFGILYEFKKG